MTLVSAGADDIIWRPHPGTNQERFLACSAREAFFAGEANSGKSDAMLMAPLRWMHLPEYSAIILRRTWPAIRDSLLPKVFQLYPRLGGQEYEGGRLWRWPGGGRVRFMSMERAEDRFQFKSQEHEFIGFEELDTFEELQYTYLFSRNRTSKRQLDGSFYPLRMRANANPGGPGTDWIIRRWGPWIYPPPRPRRGADGRIVLGPEGEPILDSHPDTPQDYDGPFAKSRQRLYAITDDRTGRQTYVPEGTPSAISRVYFAAKLEENRAVDVDEYRTSLGALDPLTREQLEKANWFARAKAGMFFDRTWLGPHGFQDAAPLKVRMRARIWDRAATEENAQNKDPDWTAGVLMSLCFDGYIWIEDVEKKRVGPGDVEKLILSTADLDASRLGTPTAVALLHDPGQAGKYEMHNYVRVLGRYQVVPIQVHKDKVTMGKPFAAAAKNGRVRLVRGPWNHEFISELERFPDGDHDDQWDCAANGYRLLQGSGGTGIVSTSSGSEQKRVQGLPSMHRSRGGF